MWRETLGRVGVWRGVLDVGPTEARRIEKLGFGTLWQGSSPSADLRIAETILEGTDRLRVATGIVNIWRSDPRELAASFRRIEAAHPDRLFIGLGSGHREATPQRVRPLEAMSAYLDVLDAEGVPVARRLISALGPRMLQIARERSAGTHPYLTTPAQTRHARDSLGPHALVAPELTVALDPDSDSARRVAREFLAGYLGMSNYVNSMRSAGFTSADLSGEGSDQLVDALVAHGTASEVVTRIGEHLDMGADHVCVQVLPKSSDIFPSLELIAESMRLPRFHV